MKILEIENSLKNVNYVPTKEILFALSGCINEKIPLLIEGAPGSGKTSLAKSVADMLNIPMYRIQFYEGLTADKILYDYDYQKQLLTIESIKSALESNLKGKNIDDAINIVKDINFYGEQFLIKRPILKAITNNEPCVLLLDEVDKASEEIEYTLLEVLDEFSMTIPQYGTVSCKEEFKPIVFLTSNNYRDLSDALKRRCNYLYIEQKSEEEMLEILKLKTNVSEQLAKGISNCITQIQELDLKQVPSIAEAINWAKYLHENLNEDLTEINNTLFMLAKNKDDMDKIKSSHIIQNTFK